MKRLLLIPLLAIALSACTVPPYFHLSPAAKSVTLWDVNAYRGAHGLPALAYNPALQAKADHLAYWMANGGCGRGDNGFANICHSDLPSEVFVPWTLLEENVGMICPPDPAALENAFEHSTLHRDNILGPVTSYAVGAVEQDGCLYVTEEFLA